MKPRSHLNVAPGGLGGWGAGGPRPTPAAAARRHFYMTPIKLDEKFKKPKCDNERLLGSGVAKVQVKTDLFRRVKD